MMTIDPKLIYLQPPLATLFYLLTTELASKKQILVNNIIIIDVHVI